MTSTALVRGRAAPALNPRTAQQADRETIERLLTSFWNGRSPHTLAAYRSDVEQFCAYLTRACGLDPKLPQIETLRVFFGSSAGRANELVLNYRHDMRAVDKAPKTINRRLAAIRSLVKLGRLTGAVYWSLEVEGVPDELTRDTRGPTPDVVASLIATAGAQPRQPIALRDVAMLRLLFDLGLRIGEAVRLDVADLELATGGVWVLGKKRARKQLLTMPAPTREAVRAWLAVRGKQPGPLFLSYSLNPASRERRLITRGAYRIVRNLGAKIGIRCHPHMLRHSAITAAVEKSVGMGLSLDKVRDFSRHKNIGTLMVYRDNMTNEQGNLAAAVAGTTAPKPPKP